MADETQLYLRRGGNYLDGGLVWKDGQFYALRVMLSEPGRKLRTIEEAEALLRVSHAATVAFLGSGEPPPLGVDVLIATKPGLTPDTGYAKPPVVDDLVENGWTLAS
jgi:hypothetical protein